MTTVQNGFVSEIVWMEQHWLHVPERISFKSAVLAYRSIHGTSPSYLQSCCIRAADMTSKRRLRSSATHRLETRSTARSTLYSRQTGVRSCRHQHVERPSAAHRICIVVTCGLQAVSQDFPRLSCLPGHPDMTYLSLLIIIIF